MKHDSEFMSGQRLNIKGQLWSNQSVISVSGSPDVISTSIPARQEVGREGKRCAVRSYPGY